MNPHEKTAGDGPIWGWIGGFVGSMSPILLLVGVLFYRGDTVGGGVGLLILTVCLGILLSFLPWKRPATHLWKLYLITMLPILAGYGWIAYRMILQDSTWHNSFFGMVSIIFLLLMPCIIHGRKTWRQMH